MDWVLFWEHQLATVNYPNQVNFNYKFAPQKLKPIGEYESLGQRIKTKLINLTDLIWLNLQLLKMDKWKKLMNLIMAEKNHCVNIIGI